MGGAFIFKNSRADTARLDGSGLSLWFALVIRLSCPIFLLLIVSFLSRFSVFLCGQPIIEGTASYAKVESKGSYFTIV
jgi:hypothetical protein